MPSSKPKSRLSRQDWIDAGLKALAEKGLTALAVEPLARQLKVTKGSFYWHFKDINALIDAVLKQWAVTATKATINRLNRIQDPKKRLLNLMSPSQALPVVSRVDLALAAAVGDERVRHWRRIHDRLWLNFASKAYAEIGFSRDTARYRARLAYSAHLGLVSLLAVDPDLPDVSDYVSFLRKNLVTPFC